MLFTGGSRQLLPCIPTDFCNVCLYELMQAIDFVLKQRYTIRVITCGVLPTDSGHDVY